MAEAPGSTADFERLVLFDGVCAFCDATVSWMMERDPEARIRYAPLQGEAAAALRARHPEIPHDHDTVVYVERLGGQERVFLRSRAIFRVCAELEPRPAWLPWISWLPAPLADLGYRAFVRLRYRLFGKLDACRVPNETERARFLA
jgi:predicted DCC family thiol-disulfide oxidoreductase YuxK